MSALLLVVALSLAGPGRAEWGPWDQRWAPVGEIEATPARRSPRQGALERAYRWYRKVSETNGGGCPFYPTCSAYGILAVRQHGVVLGALYTIDRLFREYPFMEYAHHYPLVTPHGIPRLYDPVPAPRRSAREGD